ncbi:MAG: hypothetical protein V4654_07710 [Bdellovibrionota bacterium]
MQVRFKHIFFILFFSYPCWAVDFDSKTEIYIAGNSYSIESEFAEKSQVLYFLTSDTKVKLNSKYEFALSPEIYYLDNQKSEHKDKALVEPKELGLNYFGSKLSWTLGFFQMKKEGPDVLDPLDYQQPKNYLDPLHSGKLSLLGVKAELAINNYLTFEVGFTPQNRIPVIPQESSAWYPREGILPTESDSFLITLPENPNYHIHNEERSKDDLKNNYIFKTKITTSYTDIVLQVAETLSSSPEISPTLTGNLISASPVYTIELTNPIELDVRWRKVKNYGGGFNIPLESLGLIIKIFSNQEVTESKKTLMTTVAFEKTLGNLITVLETTSQKINSRVDNSNLSTMTNLYKNAQALGLRYDPNDKFSLLVGGLYDSDQGSYIATLRPKYFFTQNAYTELQLIAVGGEKESLLSYFDKADSASLKIGTSF